jgi:hypothetical protein
VYTPVEVETKKKSVVPAQARKWRQSAEALQSRIAQRDSGDLAVSAEREQLRAAVRELGQASDAKAEAAKLHERVARARAKEVRSRSFRVSGRANGFFLSVIANLMNYLIMLPLKSIFFAVLTCGQGMVSKLGSTSGSAAFRI